MAPILLNSCARAATAVEARYRIDAPIEGRRAARVVALDDAAATVVRRVAGQPWAGARFYTLRVGAPADGVAGRADVPLRRLDGADTHLQQEIGDADVAVMVGTASSDGRAAGAIGQACLRRGIMTAGLVLGDRYEVQEAVASLRPHARVLLITADDEDVAEVLTALRA